MEDYEPLLRGIGWRPEDIAARSLARTGALLVVAASKPGLRRITDNTDLFLVLPTGTMRPLTNDTAGYGYVQFSDDNRYAAYASRDGATTPADAAAAIPKIPWALYVQDLRTGTRRRMFHEPAADPSLAPTLYGWIPGAHALLYSPAANRALYLIHAARSAPVRVMPAPLIITRDWRRALWVSAPPSPAITVRLLPGSPADMLKPEAWQSFHVQGAFRLPSEPDFTGFADEDLPQFSPDGKRVAFFTGPPDTRDRQLCVIELETGAVRCLGAIVPSPVNIVWDAQGHRLLCTQRNEHGGTRFAVDVERIAPRPIGDIQWSYPGRAVIEAPDDDSPP